VGFWIPFQIVFLVDGILYRKEHQTPGIKRRVPLQTRTHRRQLRHLPLLHILQLQAYLQLIQQEVEREVEKCTVDTIRIHPQLTWLSEQRQFLVLKMLNHITGLAAKQKETENTKVLDHADIVCEYRLHSQ
jgi:hypothetical protein